MMNQILQNQNQGKFLQYLAAQRQFYNEEKRWISIWIPAVTIVSILGAGTLAFLDPMTPYISLVATLILLGEIVTLIFITKRRSNAASIQELFDCELLELPWNAYLTKIPAPEIISSAAKRHQQQSTPEDLGKLPNWYTSPTIADLPLHKARIICQRENLLWDEKQRREYVVWVGIALVLVATILAAISIAADWSASEFFSGPVLLMLPIFGFAAKHIFDHIKAILRLIELNKLADELWNKASLESADPDEITHQCRQLQNEIYHHRADNPPVFNWFYNRIKNKYENIIQSQGIS